MPCWEPRPPTSLSATSVGPEGPREYQAAVTEVCDYCASPKLVWRKCKLICESCRQINKSCADL
jgi:hypothetical protein